MGFELYFINHPLATTKVYDYSNPWSESLLMLQVIWACTADGTRAEVGFLCLWLLLHTSLLESDCVTVETEESK